MRQIKIILLHSINVSLYSYSKKFEFDIPSKLKKKKTRKSKMKLHESKYYIQIKNTKSDKLKLYFNVFGFLTNNQLPLKFFCT